MSGTPARDARIWWIAGLLLLASAINYMDRQTLANAAVRIGKEFEMSQEQYGNLEAGFSWAFAVGSLFFGFLADKVSVRWLYAAVVLLWSTMGFMSGFVENYEQLLVCRTLLGFFEAGHWPCGIKTVRALLDARGRAMGNGVLQSGTSIGAIATPLIMSRMLTDDIASWRLPFQLIGAVGIRSVHALRGEPMWEFLAAPNREVTRRLLAAALTRSHMLPVIEGYVEQPISVDWARKARPEMLGYFIEHRDGFRTAMFLANIQDFNYAGIRGDTNEIISCQMYLPMPGHSATTADFFHPLVRHIETLVLENRAPYPVERTLLTSGMTLAAVDSIHNGYTPVDTPEMQVTYKAPRESLFWRE